MKVNYSGNKDWMSWDKELAKRLLNRQQQSGDASPRIDPDEIVPAMTMVTPAAERARAAASVERQDDDLADPFPHLHPTSSGESDFSLFADNTYFDIEETQIAAPGLLGAGEGVIEHDQVAAEIVVDSQTAYTPQVTGMACGGDVEHGISQATQLQTQVGTSVNASNGAGLDPTFAAFQTATVSVGAGTGLSAQHLETRPGGGNEADLDGSPTDLGVNSTNNKGVGGIVGARLLFMTISVLVRQWLWGLSLKSDSQNIVTYMFFFPRNCGAGTGTSG